MDKQIESLVAKYEEDKDFTHVPLNNEIEKLVLQKLGMKLPEQYKEYLNKYGHGGIAGVLI